MLCSVMSVETRRKRLLFLSRLCCAVNPTLSLDGYGHARFSEHAPHILYTCKHTHAPTQPSQHTPTRQRPTRTHKHTTATNINKLRTPKTFFWPLAAKFWSGRLRSSGQRSHGLHQRHEARRPRRRRREAGSLDRKGVDAKAGAEHQHNKKQQVGEDASKDMPRYA